MKSQVSQITTILDEYIQAQILVGVIWAFSQDNGPEPKSYLDAVKNHVPELWPLWMDDRSRLYLSGKIGKSAPLLKKLFVSMTMAEGGLRDEEAMAWCDRHPFIVLNFAPSGDAI
jgi:sulfite reductase alpha subunit-like flavoprotein